MAILPDLQWWITPADLPLCFFLAAAISAVVSVITFN